MKSQENRIELVTRPGQIQRQGNGCSDYFSSAAESFDHWKISSNENFLRMRMKLIPNPNFDIHASARYDHTQNGFSNVFRGKKILDLPLLVSKGFELEQQRKSTAGRLVSFAESIQVLARKMWDKGVMAV